MRTWWRRLSLMAQLVSFSKGFPVGSFLICKYVHWQETGQLLVFTNWRKWMGFVGFQNLPSFSIVCQIVFSEHFISKRGFWGVQLIHFKFLAFLYFFLTSGLEKLTIIFKKRKIDCYSTMYNLFYQCILTRWSIKFQFIFSCQIVTTDWSWWLFLLLC